METSSGATRTTDAAFSQKLHPIPMDRPKELFGASAGGSLSESSNALTLQYMFQKMSRRSLALRPSRTRARSRLISVLALIDASVGPVGDHSQLTAPNTSGERSVSSVLT